MKRTICILSLCIVSLFCLFLQNCRVVDVAIPSSPPTYSCLWMGHCHVKFNSVLLKLPDSHCPTPFTNNAMYGHFPCTSCNTLVNELNCYNNDSIQINWITSVFEKQCRAGDSPSDAINCNQNNFYNHWQDYDSIPEAPLISLEGDINLSDLKHELIIQIFGVDNYFVDNRGIITWKYTWIGNNAPSNYDSISHTWHFEYPSNGLMATYTPYTGYPSYIYVHDQFEFH